MKKKYVYKLKITRFEFRMNLRDDVLCLFERFMPRSPAQPPVVPRVMYRRISILIYRVRANAPSPLCVCLLFFFLLFAAEFFVRAKHPTPPPFQMSKIDYISGHNLPFYISFVCEFYL